MEDDRSADFFDLQKQKKPRIAAKLFNFLFVIRCSPITTRDIKSNTTLFINEKKWLKGKFSWQEGFGAFTYGQSQLPAIVSYIKNQEEHHKKKTFKEEYVGFLKKFEIDYNEKYLFEFYN